jgi:hypothetical protein
MHGKDRRSVQAEFDEQGLDSERVLPFKVFVATSLRIPF